MRLEDCQRLLADARCICGEEIGGEPVQFQHEQGETYYHSDGWNLEGFTRRVWLWIKCPKCGHDNSLHHLGIERPEPKRDYFEIY